MRRYFKRYLERGKRHPFLLVTPRQVKDTARRIAAGREEYLLKALGAVLANASPDPRTSRLGPAIKQAKATLNAAYLAALHAASGDARKSGVYAARAKNALVRFAEIGAPDRNADYGWLGHMYIVTLAFAYDLVWELVEWSLREREALKRFFYCCHAALVDHMHSKHMSNHAAWPMCRVGTTALLYGDEALVRECLDGPDSYCHRLAHEFFDDGMSYEQSAWGYQAFSLAPMVFLAVAAGNAGAAPDPLRLKVRNEFSLEFLGGSTGNYTMPFYPVDTREFPRPKTKDLRLSLTAQWQLLRPDATCPSIGDYGEPTPPVSDTWLPEMAWDLYGDEASAKLLSLGKRPAGYSLLFAEHFLTLALGKPLPARPRFDSRSTIYPQAGYAVLKSVEGAGFIGSKSTHAVLKFGPYGNGHGHADKLSLDISGAGRKTCIEELGRKVVSWRYWNSTVSHNAVVVNGRSQPGDSEMFALNDSCGRLVFREFSKNLKVASAEANDVYAGLRTYRRTVALAGSYLVDIFEVEAGRPAVFDWFLHGKGRLGVRGVALRKGRLGFGSHGYQYLKNTRTGAAVRPFVGIFSEGHSVFFPAVGGATIFTTVGPWKKGEGRPALIVRRRGGKAVFVAVHDPSGAFVRAVTWTNGPDDAILLTVKCMGRTDVFEYRRATPRLTGRAGARPQAATRLKMSRVRSGD